MISIQINAVEANANLQKLANRLADRRGVNNALAIDLTKLVFRNFDTESHDGTPWAPLAPSTLRSRERRQGKKLTMHKILQDTTYMKQSFMPFSDNDEAGVGARSNVQVHDGLDHADLSEIHEAGTSKIPARPMLPGRDVALAQAMKVYTIFVDRAAKP